jgi:hypothetical protein
MPIFKPLKPAAQDDEKRSPFDRPQVMAGSRGPSAPNVAAQAQAPAQQAMGGQTSVQGGNFVNIQDYLKANEGQGKQMSDRVAGGIESQASGIRATQPVQNRYIQGLASAPKPQNTATEALGISSRTPSYLEGQAELDAAGEVSRKADLAGTAGGQTELLDQAYGKGRSSGEADFDNALMGGGGGGTKLGELNKKYAGLSSWLQADRAGAASRANEKAAGEEDRRRFQAGEMEEFYRQHPSARPGFENTDNGPRGRGIGGPTARERIGDYESFAAGTNAANIQSGNNWFRSNVSEKLYNSLSDEDLEMLQKTVAAAGGERDGSVNNLLATLSKKYGA